MGEPQRGVKHPATLIPHANIAKLCKPVSAFAEERAGWLEKLRVKTPKDYKPQALASCEVGAYGAGNGHKEITGDGEQAYMQVVMAMATSASAATGDSAVYAKNAVAILRGWAVTCKSFEGGNAPLELGWAMASMARAAELLKHVSCLKGWWSAGDEAAFLSFLDKIVMPKLTKKLDWTNNWSLTICEARLQIGLFRNDPSVIDWAVKEYKRIVDVYVRANGRTEETTRDMIHAQFGLGSLIQIPELLWHQGVDLYGYKNNLMHRAMEYHAGILLGRVPGDLKAAEITQNWFIPCGWEMSLAHYAGRKGMAMPAVTELLKKKRPEPYTFHWGLGTLTHRIP